jgi:hypothetical protein
MFAIATPGIPHLPLGPKFRLAAPGKVMHGDVMRALFLQRVLSVEHCKSLNLPYKASIFSQK